MVGGKRLRNEEMCRNRVETLYQCTLLLVIVLDILLQQILCLSLTSMLTVVSEQPVCLSLRSLLTVLLKKEA
jgi:hypothetical protein